MKGLPWQWAVLKINKSSELENNLINCEQQSYASKSSQKLPRDAAMIQVKMTVRSFMIYLVEILQDAIFLLQIDSMMVFA